MPIITAKLNPADPWPKRPATSRARRSARRQRRRAHQSAAHAQRQLAANNLSTTLGTVTTVLANGFQYPPFSSQATSLSFGNGKTIWRSLNQDYQITYDFSGPRYKRLTRQADGNIKTIFDVMYGAQEDLSYDATGRLLSATDTDPTSFGTRAYTYDALRGQVLTSQFSCLNFTYGPPPPARIPRCALPRHFPRQDQNPGVKS